MLAGISMLSAKVARELFLYVVRLAEKLSDISYFQQRRRFSALESYKRVYTLHTTRVYSSPLAVYIIYWKATIDKLSERYSVRLFVVADNRSFTLAPFRAGRSVYSNVRVQHNHLGTCKAPRDRDTRATNDIRDTIDTSGTSNINTYRA